MKFTKTKMVLIGVGLVAILVVILISIRQPQPPIYVVVTPVSMNPQYRALWDAKNIRSYEIKIVTLRLPVLPISLNLTVQNGTITKRNDLACDKLSKEYSVRDCETISKYYSQSGAYTIEELFDIADTCTRNTKDSLAKCPQFEGDNFQGYSDFEKMYQMSEACYDYLQAPATLCSVEYDKVYGYPKAITQTAPQLLDGGAVITIEAFKPK